MLTNEAAGLVINIALGIIKLGKRIDLLWAEKAAFESPLALPLPSLAKPPTVPKMRRALDELLNDTEGDVPDPLGTDRERIQSVLENNAGGTILEKYMDKYLPAQMFERVIDLDQEFITALREADPDFVEDPDILTSAFYIRAGQSFQKKSYSWRLALTVVDAVADFGSENAQIFTRDKNIQLIVSSVLVRFGDNDIDTVESTSELLKIVLSSTLNGVLDNKNLIQNDMAWLNTLLGALSDVRAELPENRRDNFVAGLLQGKGYPLLVADLLEKGAEKLLEENRQNFEMTAASFLQEVAGVVQQKPSFEHFFQENWGELLRAGFASLEKHGPQLLGDQNILLQEVMTAVVGNLARSPNNKLLDAKILTSIIDTAISTVATHPDKVEDLVKQEWLGALISSISTTLAHDGIRNAFSQKGLSAIMQTTLNTFADNPELVVDEPGLARNLLRDLLGNLGNLNSISVESLALVAVDSALNTLVAHPELVSTKYTDLVASSTEQIAKLVQEKRLTNLQGREILKSVVMVFSENPNLFTNIEKRFASFVIDASLAVSAESRGLLSGATLVKSIEVILKSIAASGNAALKNHPAANIAEQLEMLLTAGIVRAEKEIGNQMTVSMTPFVLGSLVELWAKGGVSSFDPANDNFRRVFTELVVKAST